MQLLTRPRQVLILLLLAASTLLLLIIQPGEEPALRSLAPSPVLGISPLIFFASGQTAFLSLMAVSLGFGLLFATALILVAVPCFYLIADDLRQRVSGWVRRAAGHPARRM